MKVGDLVKHTVPEEAQHQASAGKNRPVGIILEWSDDGWLVHFSALESTFHIKPIMLELVHGL